MANGLFTGFLRTVVRLLGGLGAGMAIILVVSAWKLSSGPISLAFLTPYIETALATFHKSFRIRLDDTILTWAGWERTLDIRVLNFRALGEGDSVIASVPEISLSLSAQALTHGLIAPQSIELFRPNLHVVRHRDGTLQVGFNTDTAQSEDFMNTMFALMLQEPDPSNPMSYLSRVNIFDADVQVVDQQLETSWRAPKAQAELLRDARGIKGDITMDVLVGDTKANVSVLGTYLMAEGRFDLGVDFNQLRPDAFAALSPQLSRLAGIEVPFQGTLTLSMLTDGTLESLGFDVAGSRGALSVPVKTAQKMGFLGLAQRVDVEKIELRGRYEGTADKIEINNLTFEFGSDGKIYLPAPIDHEMPVRTISTRGRFLGVASRLELDAVELDLGGPEASIALNMVAGEKGVSVGASGVLRNMKVDELSTYWPKALAGDARAWIVEHISKGNVPEARAALQMRSLKDTGTELVSLEGDMTIRGVTVDYLPPMPKAVNTNATARFTSKKFDIFISQAQSEGMATRKGILSFKGLDGDDQYADMDLFIKGPLKNALKIIESEPLGFLSTLGLNPDYADGSVDAHLKLGFQLENTLKADSIDVTVAAKVHDVSVDKVILGQGIQDGQLELKATRNGLDLNGDVKLGSIPASFEWRRNFIDDAPFRSQYKIDARIANIRSLRDLGIDLSPLDGDFIEGGVGANIQLTTHDDGKGQVQVRLDLDDVALNATAFGWEKPKGVAGIAQADIEIEADRLVAIPRFSLAAGNLRLNGSASYAADGTGLEKVDIARVSFNRTDLSGVVIPGHDGGWTVSFHGPSFDLEPMFDDLFKTSPDNEDRFGLQLSLSTKIDKVWLGPKRYLKQITGTFSRANDQWRSMKIDGAVGEGKSFQVQLGPGGKGKRDVSIQAEDAGNLLKTLDIYHAMIGGRLDVDASFDDTTPGHPLSGEVLISNYRLVDAPALARLVGILTLTGIADALQGDGLSFSEFKVPFVMSEGVIDIIDAKATGLSLGYTAKGKIYNYAEVIDIEGTVVPAYAINSVLGNIPLIGTLLTGVEEGGGIFAATYEMNGPLEDPDVKVNPLSALAPGIFRNLFGIFTAGDDKNEESAGAEKTERKQPLGKSEGL